MNTVLLANLVSLAGCLLMVSIGFVKKKKWILGLQCIQFGIMGTGNLILGAYAGAIAGMVSILRNLAFFKFEGTLKLKLLFIGIQTLLSLPSLQTGWLEWLPLLSTILFTCFLDVKSEVLLKLVIIIAQAFWMVYDLCYQNYTTMTFDFLTMISTIIGIVMILRDKKRNSSTT